MFKSCWETVCSEFRLMIKEKMILVVVVGIPLFVNILLGLVLYNNQIKHIPMAVVDQDNSALSRMIVEQFRENEIFNVKYDAGSSEELKSLLDSSKVRVGMIIPQGFSQDVTELKSPTVLMLYDGSHLSIASAAKTRATEILMTMKTGVLIKLLEGKLNLPSDVAKKMALDIQFSNRTLYNPTKSFKNFLIPGMGTAIVQSGIALMAASAVRGLEIRRGRKKRAGYITGKVVFYGGIGTLSLLLCIFIQTAVLGVPFRGNIGSAVLLSLAFAIAVSTLSLAVSAWVKNEMMSTIVNAIIFVPNTVLVGYTWPVMSMPEPYRAAAVFFPFYHYADNIRDLCLKGSTSAPVGQDLRWMLTFALIAFVAAYLGIEMRNPVKSMETQSVHTQKFSRLLKKLTPAREDEGNEAC